MRAPAPRPIPVLAAALSLTFGAAVASAQEMPPPPPSPNALLARSPESPLDPRVHLAVHLLRTRQTEDAVAVLARLMLERAVDGRGYDPVAVLFRLANGRARPGTPTGGALSATAPAPTGATGDELPPPPSDEAIQARVIDSVVERLARWDEAGARAFLDRAVDEAASQGPNGTVFRALQSIARGGVAAPAADVPTGAGYAFSPVSQLLPDRPAGTIEGFEVLTLYASTATYGLMLGTWAGLAATDDNRNALRVALPLTGVTAGLVGAIVLDRARVVRRGRGYAVNSGLLLGTLAGTAAMIYAGADEPAVSWGFALGGATLGIGAALGLAHFADALPGSVSYVTSAGLWGSVVGIAMALALDGDDLRSETAASGILIGEGVGVVLALLSAEALKPTPGQTRWADVGACLGGMLGASLGAGSTSTTGVGVGMAIGVLGGGALAWFLATPNESDRAAYLQHNASRDLPLRFGVSPLPGGGLLHVGL